MTDVEPRRETTEPMTCLDCREETPHLVIEWTFNTTTECRECGLISSLGEM